MTTLEGRLYNFDGNSFNRALRESIKRFRAKTGLEPTDIFVNEFQFKEYDPVEGIELHGVRLIFLNQIWVVRRVEDEKISSKT